MPSPTSSTELSGRAKTALVLGKGTLAIRIADWFCRSSEYELTLVVPVVPEPAWTDSLTAWASESAVPIVASGNYADIEGVHDEGWGVDLAFSVFYDRIVAGWFIARCGRILNLHNGPLPRYRGVSPINWALKNGESMHGVTIHEITAGIDDGPIVAQALYSIYPEIDEVRDVYARALAYGWTLFEQTMPLLEQITPVSQRESEATYYGMKDNALLGDRRGFTRAESLDTPPNG